MDRENAQLAIIRALNLEARQGLEDHPSSDEILDYHEQAMSADAADALRDHFAICPDCARRALDLSAFLRPELVLDEGDPPSKSAAEDWQELEQALDRQGPRGGSEAPWMPSTAQANRTIWGSVTFAYAIAALFFLTSLGLSLRLFFLPGEAAPQAGPRLTDLQPTEVTQRDGTIASAPPVDVRVDNVLILVVSSVDSARLDLDSDGRPVQTGYTAKIVDLRRKERPVVAILDDLELIDSSCTIRIPGYSLMTGAYGIQLFVPGGELLADYELVVEDSMLSR